MGLFGKNAKSFLLDKGYEKEGGERAVPLGTGNFAEVYKAKRKTTIKWDHGNGNEGTLNEGEYVAIKIIDKSKVEDMNDITREIDIMKKVKHENIIQLYECLDEPKRMNLVMELVTGGELFDRIVSKGNYSEKDAATTIVTLCSALHHLHERKIVHRDLKPENILYKDTSDDSPIKLADFGLAREIAPGGAMMKTACGTPGYVAPEILKNEGYDSPAVDMWSVGVILYILLCGFPPFYEEELPALFDSILHARYDFPSPWWDTISPGGKTLVKELLELKIDKRLDAKTTMQHDFCKTASDKSLSDAQKALKKFQANRRLRKAALGVIAQQRLEKALAELRMAK
uniref:Protein kinase domain-containing protein n=1 Tax=Haptolina brevifila TaxID=156173 RepID=A0A7S2I5N9_9EUKA|mmetsp:Transcript_61826/g.122248  ORF Transcript_61826/g.122248 Transcript_61826/m.122248 type:complete len:343 (+) Transcript_61826:68-1096(+)